MKNLTKSLMISLLATVYGNTTQAQTYIQSYGNVVNQVSQSGILTNLTEFENLGVKYRGTLAQANTLQWLKNKYLSYGYTASQLTEDTFTYSGATCKNLIVTKIGTVYPNTYVIVCGHYDTITGTGTNDNGSGVSTILEIARLLQNIPTEYSIKFINFSGEEDGLRGSQNYVSTVVNGTTPKMSIKLVFNIDEVGGVAGMLNNTITCERDTGNPSANNAASNTITNELIKCTQLYSPLQTKLSYAYASDYMPFQSNGEIITGFFETNETTHAHTTQDLLVNMDPAYVYKVAKAATGATLHFAKATTTASLGTDAFEKDFNVSFFPNPVKDYLTINKGKLEVNEYVFTLVDLNGKQVLQQNVTNAKLLESVDISKLSKGIYMGILETGEYRISKKIVIE
ncbi:M28 family peptidase [Flavobacterium supellecticarium]|uniref:M28 family peptidase n=1 Tax=Flavobacterium supellecticarium TaxID=2565924 RepID=A0A4S4A6A7_9FLAO|nr:M28 family peptidase [Flavobacterium supellecticarium]THF53495.1 M28 family peptidase [Flavobacterium supellecticarium]